MQNDISPYLGQIYFYYQHEDREGYYYSFDGKTVAKSLPEGGEPPDIAENEPHIFDRSEDDPLRIGATEVTQNIALTLGDEIQTNKEAYYLLSQHDTNIIIGAQSDKIFYSAPFINPGSFRPLDELDTKTYDAGRAHVFHNSLVIADGTLDTATNYFREEVSHMTDYKIAREADYLILKKTMYSDMISDDIG